MMMWKREINDALYMLQFAKRKNKISRSARAQPTLTLSLSDLSLSLTGPPMPGKAPLTPTQLNPRTLRVFLFFGWDKVKSEGL
jgi:hypothetical protein